MSPSGTSTRVVPNAFCPTQHNSSESIQLPSSPTAPRRDLLPLADQILVAHGSVTEAKLPFVDALTHLAAVKAMNVVSATSAKPVRSRDTTKKPVMVAQSEHYRLNPKYLCHNIWDEDLVSLSFSTLRWTETATLLVTIPATELDNPIAAKTVCKNANLFKIVTHINVDKFELLLSCHPNPSFIASVCDGLCNGFWPWANTLHEGYPSTHNTAYPAPPDEQKTSFLHAQCDIEISKGQFSAAFGHELLPRMYASPIHAIPKPNSTNFHMVTNHSTGDFSLNSMICHNHVTGYPLDNMKYVGGMLLKL